MVNKNILAVSILLIIFSFFLVSCDLTDTPVIEECASLEGLQKDDCLLPSDLP